MSLDVDLIEGDPVVVPCKHERCQDCYGTGTVTEGTSLVFESNITHNLNKMADAAGIYKHLWRPEEIGIEFARDLIVPLSDGLARLQTEASFFDQFDAPNGWGRRADLVRFVSEYLAACRKYPNARVRASR